MEEYPPNTYPTQSTEPHRGNTVRLWTKHKMNNFRRKTALNDLFIYPLDNAAEMS